MKNDFTDLTAKLFVLHDIAFEDGIYWVFQKSDGIKVLGSVGVSKADALQRVVPNLVFDRNNQITSVFL